MKHWWCMECQAEVGLGQTRPMCDLRIGSRGLDPEQRRVKPFSFRDNHEFGPSFGPCLS